MVESRKTTPSPLVVKLVGGEKKGEERKRKERKEKKKKRKGKRSKKRQKRNGSRNVRIKREPGGK